MMIVDAVVTESREKKQLSNGKRIIWVRQRDLSWKGGIPSEKAQGRNNEVQDKALSRGIPSCSR